MEETSEDARRKKILDNAEARLRFIKEGVPWRREEAEKFKTVPEKEPVENEIETIPKQECSPPNDDLITNLNSITLSKNSDNTKTGTVDNANETNNFNNASEIKDDYTSSNSFINREASSSGFKSVDESGNNLLRERDSSMLSAQVESETGLSSRSLNTETRTVNAMKTLNTGNQSENALRTLKALLRESTNERQEHKRKSDQLNKNMWLSCFLMLFLGVFTRIAYAVQLSWLFNGVMLVPFVTGAVPIIVSLARDPPTPSGTIVQVLLMAGVKATVLRRAFAIFTVLRTFLQLFSVFLISFVFSHQISLSY